MKAFARFTVSGQFPALAVVFSFSLLTILLQLVVFSPSLSLISALISSSAVVLIALYTNPKNALFITLVAALATGAFSYVFVKAFAVGLTASIVQLAPSLLFATILRQTRSLSFSMQVAAITGVGIFLALSLFAPDSSQAWEKLLQSVINKDVLDESNITEEKSQLLIKQLSSVMNGALISLTLLLHGSALLIGYWWHSLVDASSDFKNAFYNLHLGKVLGISVVALLVASAASGSTIFAQIFFVTAILFILQGLAIVHSIASRMTNGRTWLIISYVLIFIITPLTLLLLMFLGIVDTFINIRKRI